MHGHGSVSARAHLSVDKSVSPLALLIDMQLLENAAWFTCLRLFLDCEHIESNNYVLLFFAS